MPSAPPFGRARMANDVGAVSTFAVVPPILGHEAPVACSPPCFAFDLSAMRRIAEGALKKLRTKHVRCVGDCVEGMVATEVVRPCPDRFCVWLFENVGMPVSCGVDVVKGMSPLVVRSSRLRPCTAGTVPLAQGRYYNGRRPTRWPSKEEHRQKVYGFHGIAPLAAMSHGVPGHLGLQIIRAPFGSLFPRALIRPLVGVSAQMVHRRNWSLGFRFGSKACIQRRLSDVRFTPESGLWNSVTECPLCAKSGHQPSHSMNSSARAESVGGTSM